ncbi:hypothetical protein X801_00302 [Opisthorchis viverrini]|uniref:Uncharacterized protein n=2 Tax=Opisthorchis viverrini TaxID=6198 RepID=A0A1S8XAN7_OPIVI|nr:hypothetical protein T265_05580 [Opisthorchis viverrini]KER27330.1 hypothetical protein T265_05580 [Opisthorchis viverrini]OON23781.1 hypothetical protein X801_00302 [Opisthorchis viverrini]
MKNRNSIEKSRFRLIGCLCVLLHLQITSSLGIPLRRPALENADPNFLDTRDQSPFESELPESRFPRFFIRRYATDDGLKSTPALDRSEESYLRQLIARSNQLRALRFG